MSTKVISFTIPLSLAEFFYVIIDDGRIYRVNKSENSQPGETLVVEVLGENLITSKEYSENENDLTEEILVSTMIIGTLFLEPVTENLVMGYTLRDGGDGVRIDPTETGDITPNNTLLQSIGTTFNHATNLITTQVKKIDEIYHVSDQVRAIDDQYHVTQKAKAASDMVVENVQSIDQTLKVSETVKTTATSLEEKYHITENVKTAATTLTNAAIVASSMAMHQAQTINETYHVTDNVKSAVDVVTTKAQEIDHRYHVTETVMATAETVVNEVKKVGENILPATSTEPTPEVDPDLDEETHTHLN